MAYTTLTQGNNVTITFDDAADGLEVINRVQDSATLVFSNGQSVLHTGRKVYSPGAGSVVLTAVSGSLQYEYTNNSINNSPLTPFASNEQTALRAVATGAWASRVGNIAGRLVIPNRYNAGTAAMSRSYHYAGAGVSWIQAEFPNWYVSGVNNSSVDGLEKGPGAAATIVAVLEYPIGTIAGSFTFSGSTTGSIPDGGKLLSDRFNVNIPPRAFFRISTYRTCSAGIVYHSNVPYYGLTQDEHKISGATDQTGNLTNVGSSGGNTYTPTAIISDTIAESVYIFGDSLPLGTDLDQGRDLTGTTGLFARACALKFIPFVNGGVGSQQAQFLSTSYTNQLATMAYHTRVIGHLGTNDVFASRTPTQVLTDLGTIYTAIATAYPSMRLIYSTMLPRMNTSTDYFTTTTNQSNSTATFPPKIASLNDKIRAGALTQLHGIIDTGPVLESSPGSQKWRVHPLARTVTDGAMTAASTTLTSASAAFTFADEGQTIVVVNAGNAGGTTDLVTTISSYTNATTVVLANAVVKTGGITTATVYIGARWLTQDGTHPNDVGNRLILNANVIQPQLPW